MDDGQQAIKNIQWALSSYELKISNSNVYEMNQTKRFNIMFSIKRTVFVEKKDEMKHL